ncbi:MOB1A [Symbiodinium microadriaticum]|nr:MOB1A [Symbiodinium microadriaticum]
MNVVITLSFCSGSMRNAVVLPLGEDKDEWLAANTVDFFNEVSLIWGITCDSEMPTYGPGEGFPIGFEYLWADGIRIKNPIRCSSTEYVDYVMTWIEDQINNEQIFPVSSDQPFPRNYMTVVKQIFTRLFRIFAIIYTHHFTRLEELCAVAHLNTSFKHFCFFIWEYDLVDARELGALQDIASALKDNYDAGGA